MRKFSSYGPIDKSIHYYVPRAELIERTCQRLRGENPDQGGHYITVWAPRQTGKTWMLQQVRLQLQASAEFDVAILTMQSAKSVTTAEGILEILILGLRHWFGREDIPLIREWQHLPQLFTSRYFDKPLILILDEFDAIESKLLNVFVNEFRAIHTARQNETDKPSGEKRYLLHGLALIGVRGVLGVENTTGSPFNVQQSIHVPNLTKDEVASMFRWYEEESGQKVEPEVVDRLFYETRGQPGLVSWFGELLTENYNRHESTITDRDFDIAFSAGLNILPNNNILNIVSKAKQEPYVDTIYALYKTDEKMGFSYDDPHLNFLYFNGVIDQTTDDQFNYYVRFASPFVQKRLFNYFARQFFGNLGRLYDPFADLSETITDTTVSIPHLMQRYELYLQQNHERILKDAPRRESDNRVIEAVFHFNLYTWLYQFFNDFNGRVTPEFPTGNGKIDLLVTYANRLYGIEVKSFVNRTKYKEGLEQAARYGKQLGQSEIWLVFFVEAVDDENRKKLEVPYQDSETGVTVYPILVATGN